MTHAEHSLLILQPEQLIQFAVELIQFAVFSIVKGFEAVLKSNSFN
jgi:hypothetical protein